MRRNGLGGLLQCGCVCGTDGATGFGQLGRNMAVSMLPSKVLLLFVIKNQDRLN